MSGLIESDEPKLCKKGPCEKRGSKKALQWNNFLPDFPCCWREIVFDQNFHISFSEIGLKVLRRCWLEILPAPSRETPIVVQEALAGRQLLKIARIRLIAAHMDDFVIAFEFAVHGLERVILDPIQHIC